MPVAYKENLEEKRLESMEYLSIAIPRLLKKPLIKERINKFMSAYYDLLYKHNKGIENGEYTGIEYRQKIKYLKERYIEHNAKYFLSRGLLFDKEFREEQWQFAFHLVEEYVDKHNLVFKRTEWEISLPQKDIKRFIKAMDRLEKYSLKKDKSEVLTTLTIKIHQPIE